MAAWSPDPGAPLPASLLARLRREAAAVPRAPVQSVALPAFYNLFPAGYHFFVAEALFLTGQLSALREWVCDTSLAFPELVSLEQNVCNELLRAFQAVASLKTQAPQPVAAYVPATFRPEESTWLLDYYWVHIWLAQLHFAATTDTAEAERLRALVHDFAVRHGMPFFERVARQIG